MNETIELISYSGLIMAGVLLGLAIFGIIQVVSNDNRDTRGDK